MLTKGWDTISIVKKDRINSDIANGWSHINPSFNYEGQDYGVSGVFAAWNIVDGGGGRLLRMKMPIKAGELTVNRNKMSLAGVSAIIEITLSLLPLQGQIMALQAEYKLLAQSRADITPKQDGWLLPIKLDDPKGQIGIYATLALNAICQYLLTNPEQLQLVFAQVYFTKSGNPDWARPRKSAYSYLDTGYLAMLSVCVDRDISKLPLDVDVTGLHSAGSSYYIVSSQLMLENLILPGLLELYKNCSQSMFAYRDGELINQERIWMRDIKSGAIYYTPSVYKEGNIARVGGDHIKVSFNGDCDLNAGIYMYWNGDVQMNASLNANGVIKFTRDGGGFSHHEDIPWYLRWLSPIVSVIVEIVTKVISEDLMKSIEVKGGSISASSINAVTWCDGQAEVSAAYLSESLVIEYK